MWIENEEQSRNNGRNESFHNYSGELSYMCLGPFREGFALYKENKLPNMSVLLNDTDTTNGYGYGYGQEVIKKPWYKKLFNFSYFG